MNVGKKRIQEHYERLVSVQPIHKDSKIRNAMYVLLNRDSIYLKK